MAICQRCDLPMLTERPHEMDDCIKVLREANRELEKDRDRLDWVVESHAWIEENDMQGNWWCVTPSNISKAKSLRDAIDAAMAEGGKGDDPN